LEIWIRPSVSMSEYLRFRYCRFTRLGDSEMILHPSGSNRQFFKLRVVRYFGFKILSSIFEKFVLELMFTLDIFRTLRLFFLSPIEFFRVKGLTKLS